MPIRCHIKRSPCLIASLCSLHGVALSVLWLTRMDGWASIFLSVVILLSLAAYLRQIAQSFSDANPIVFSMDENGITFFGIGDAQWRGIVLPQTVVLPVFVLLCLRAQTSRERRFQLIFFDAMHAAEFRQLRTLLKVNG